MNVTARSDPDIRKHYAVTQLAARLEHFTGHRGNGQWGILNVLVAELRGNDDHIAADVVIGVFLRECRSARDRVGRDPEGHLWNFGTYDPWSES